MLTAALLLLPPRITALATARLHAAVAAIPDPLFAAVGLTRHPAPPCDYTGHANRIVTRSNFSSAT